MIRYFLIVLGIYFLYRFIFHFLIPVSKTAGEIKKRMSDFQDQMNPRNFNAQPQQSKQESAQKSGDYLDFEEVK